MKMLILGASGMLGHALLHIFGRRPEFIVRGTVRDTAKPSALFPPFFHELLVGGVDAYKIETVALAIANFKPQVVINCIGLVRQLPEGSQTLPCIEINARFPHLLLDICRRHEARLIHISTDCVFDGKEDIYDENSAMSAKDVYGITKFLGELKEPPGISLRTSFIGHELRNKLGLLEWFLSQQGSVKGYARFLYSGVTTVEMARVIADFVLPHPEMTGVYQVASAPISKYDLLKLLAQAYDKDITIIPDVQVEENKILSGDKFQRATGYKAPPWPELVSQMHSSRMSYTDLS